VSAVVLLAALFSAGTGEGAPLDVPSVYPTWKTEWAIHPALGGGGLSAILAIAAFLVVACLVAAWLLLRSDGRERPGH
jgi:hypothetical protein